MFFAKNKLSFWMANGSVEFSPPTLLPHGNIVHRPKTILPWSYKRPEKISQGIVQIQHQWPLPMLEGFIFYDPFLRYLHTIGPVHAAKLKHLEFEGVIRLHQCLEGSCDVDMCLMQALNVYVNFIASFCTSVEKVEVHTILDTHFPEIEHGEMLHPWGPDTIEAVMVHVLELYVRRVPSLKVFVVFDSFGNLVLDWSLGKDGVMQFVEDAIQGTVWEREKVKAMEKHVGCGFCGEDHETRECFNLCGFCGRFGHWKRSCVEYWDCWQKEGDEEEQLTDDWLRAYPYSDRWQNQ